MNEYFVVTKEALFGALVGARGKGLTIPAALEEVLPEAQASTLAAMKAESVDRAPLLNLLRAKWPADLYVHPNWRPISDADEAIRSNCNVGTILKALELVDLDFNPDGISSGYWQEEPIGEERPGYWIAARWNGDRDCFDMIEVHPTHFLQLRGPELHS